MIFKKYKIYNWDQLNIEYIFNKERIKGFNPLILNIEEKKEGQELLF
jgi:hypothetical protein